MNFHLIRFDRKIFTKKMFLEKKTDQKFCGKIRNFMDDTTLWFLEEKNP